MSDQDFFACPQSHTDDEYLNGFIQTRTADAWLTSSSRNGDAILWRRLDISEDLQGHQYPAACIFSQILGGQVGGAPWQAFAYNHNGVGNVRPRLLEELTTAKTDLARLMQAKRNRRLGRAEEFHNQLDSAQDFEELVDVEEVMLLSFLLQARRKGFPIHCRLGISRYVITDYNETSRTF